jgi:tricorn protease
MRGIYVVTLTKEEPSLFAPRSDEGINENEASRPSLTATPTPSATTGAIPAIKIDLDGFMERAVPVPVAAADYGGLAASRDSLFYVTVEGPGAAVGQEAEAMKATLRAYDLKLRKERTICRTWRGWVWSSLSSSLSANPERRSHH